MWSKSPSGTARRAVVFVHGIFSSHDKFAKFHDGLRNPFRDLSDTDIYFYDYQYGNSLERSGETFANELAANFHGGDRNVTLICHSMGGLIARLAILSKDLPCIKTVFLLGTPNLGAISTAQLVVLTQMVRVTAGVISGLFIRKTGVTDLTRAYAILQKYEGHDDFAADVDYVSIPGCYFHAERPFFAPYTERDASKAMFGTLSVGFSVLSAIKPLFGVSMDRPHDGIVEERSNSLIPSEAGRWSEKSADINHPSLRPRRYFHVQLRACQELIHTTIQTDPDVIGLVRDIIEQPDLDAWRATLSREQLRSIKLLPVE